jgi:hypothetical protein
VTTYRNCNFEMSKAAYIILKTSSSFRNLFCKCSVRLPFHFRVMIYLNWNLIVTSSIDITEGNCLQVYTLQKNCFSFVRLNFSMK